MASGDVRRGFRLVACVAVGSCNDAVFAVTARVLRDDLPDMRDSALIVPQYTAWTQLLSEVTRLDEQDPDPSVRKITADVRFLLEVTAQLEDGRAL